MIGFPPVPYGTDAVNFSGQRITFYTLLFGIRYLQSDLASGRGFVGFAYLFD
jgi:hypothetical protein